MRVIAISDVGKARDTNQDYYEIPSKDEDIALFILADGMGGYNGGEIASKLAVGAAKNYIVTNFENTEKDKVSLQELVITCFIVICINSCSMSRTFSGRRRMNISYARA